MTTRHGILLPVVDEATTLANDMKRWELGKTRRTDLDYPRPAVLRGLAAASAALGDEWLSDEMLGRYPQVARRAPDGIIRSVAAMAIGEVLLRGRGETSVPHPALDAAWRSVFPAAAAEPAAIPEVLA